MVNITQLEAQFKQQFDSEASHLFFAPGRVNLIGEHIDYNGGHVFPCALNVGTYALARARDDMQLRLYSVNFPDTGVIELTLDDIRFNRENTWANYPAGIFKTMMNHGAHLYHGMDILFFGNIPNGAGLSSSASIELATAVLVNSLYQLAWPSIELVKQAQQAENQFNGMNCGIMDQFACGMGRAEHALLLNTHTLAHQYVPLHLGPSHVLLIANTNKRRELSDSKYNERRAECDAALADLQTNLPIQALCELDVETFEKHAHLILNPVHRCRVRHVVNENQRTLQAVSVLQRGDVAGFGALMNDSHVSLRDDYAVTGEHLDALVEAAWRHGALGARMTGAGFGGCTVMLVDAEQVEKFKFAVGAMYVEMTGLQATFYDVCVGDGARLLKVLS